MDAGVRANVQTIRGMIRSRPLDKRLIQEVLCPHPLWKGNEQGKIVCVACGKEK